MSVRVAPLTHAHTLARGWADQVVSLLDPRIPQAIIPTPETLGISAANWTCRFFEDRGDNRGATFETVRDILASIRPDTCVLVHCHAGMSRSPAIAIGILIQRGVAPATAIRTIFAQDLIDNEGDFMEPNELIISHLDRLFNLNNTLLGTLRACMR
jgi:predicted protein tyrosine phosphatase